MNLNISVSDGKKFTITVEDSYSIENLKALIQEASAIEPDSQRLLFSGTPLEDGRKISYYKIKDNSTLTLLKG